MSRHPIIAAFAAALVSCAGAEKAPDVPPPELVEQVLELQQDITNFNLRMHGKVKSQRDATIERASWEMVVDGNVVKKGEEALNVAVPAGDEGAPFELRTTTRYVSSPDELKAMSDRRGSLLAAMRGTLFIRRDGKTHSVEFARSREVRTPRLPEVVLHEVDGARHSEREVGIHIWLGVVNPNPFPLAVSGLDYVAHVADKETANGTLTRGDTINPASTGVFEFSFKVDESTHGKDVAKLIKTLNVPWKIAGTLRGDLFAIPYSIGDTMRLNVSK